MWRWRQLVLTLVVSVFKVCHDSVYECVPIQDRCGVSFIQHLNVVRHLATSATENCFGYLSLPTA